MSPERARMTSTSRILMSALYWGHRSIADLLLASVGVAVGVCIMLACVAAVRAGPTEADVYDPDQLMLGMNVYGSSCSGCHGPRLEGSWQWHRAGGLGGPPLTSSATWLQSDKQLMHSIGTDEDCAVCQEHTEVNSLPLSDNERSAVIAFVKAHWSPEKRAAHALVSGNVSEVPLQWRPIIWLQGAICASP